MRYSVCHPDRKHYGHGMCSRCYGRDRYKNNPEARDKARAQKWKKDNPEKAEKWFWANTNRRLWGSAKHHAKRDDREFSITPSDVVIPDVCPIFGTPFVFERSHPLAPSLDRIDSSKGYTPENVWVIGWRANRMKYDGTWEEFRRMADAIEKKLKGKFK